MRKRKIGPFTYEQACKRALINLQRMRVFTGDKDFPIRGDHEAQRLFTLAMDQLRSAVFTEKVRQ